MHIDETPDPRTLDPREAELLDPEAGASDDPRVDPTPDKRQSDTGTATTTADP